jgi:hypothetical protein
MGPKEPTKAKAPEKITEKIYDALIIFILNFLNTPFRFSFFLSCTKKETKNIFLCLFLQKPIRRFG